MDAKELAGMISAVSRQETTLLYYSPEELEKAIREDRGSVIVEDGKFVGCGFWADRGGGWVEFDTMYVAPEFRRRGYSRKIMQLMKEKAQKRLVGQKAFLFTQVPAMRKMVEGLGFLPVEFSALPGRLWWKIIFHRMHPKRWISYAKYLPHLNRVGSWQLYILTTDNIIK